MQANEGTPTQAGRLRDLTWLCEYLGVTEHAARHLVARNKIPVTRIDGRLRFDIVAIDKWIGRHTSSPERAA